MNKVKKEPWGSFLFVKERIKGWYYRNWRRDPWLALASVAV